MNHLPKLVKKTRIGTKPEIKTIESHYCNSLIILTTSLPIAIVSWMESVAKEATVSRAFFLKLYLVLLLGPSEDIISSFSLLPRLATATQPGY